MNFNTDIIARLFAACCLLYPPFAAYTIPSSVSGKMQMTPSDVSSIILFAVMGCIALMIITDVVVNSMFNRESWKWLARHRDNMYLLSAFCIAVVPFSAGKFTELDMAILFLYLVIFSIFVALALVDSYAKKNTVARRKKSW